LQEELNIKSIAFCERPEDYVSYEVRPNFKVLGPRFGKGVQTIKQALANGDGAAFFAQLQSGALILHIDGEDVQLSGEEVEVRLAAHEGFAAAQGRNLVVVLATEITEELRREGHMRELVRFIQEIRKEMRLPYDARIAVELHTDDPELPPVLEAFHDAIAGEVLANQITQVATAPAGAKSVEFGDFTLALGVTQI
jgi:isoleucyl-tRNA synthetase